MAGRRQLFYYEEPIGFYLTLANMATFLISLWLLQLFGAGGFKSKALGPYSCSTKVYQVSRYGAIATVYYPVDSLEARAQVQQHGLKAYKGWLDDYSHKDLWIM